MVNPNQLLKSEFQFLLAVKFRYCKKGEKPQYDYKELAPFLNKKPDTISRWIAQTNPIPVDHAKDTINFVASKNPKDLELAEFFCPPGHIIIPIVEHKVTNEERQKLQNNLIIYIGEAFKELESAHEDDRVEPKEYPLIHKWLIKIRQAAAELDEMTKQEIK